MRTITADTSNRSAGRRIAAILANECLSFLRNFGLSGRKKFFNVFSIAECSNALPQCGHVMFQLAMTGLQIRAAEVSPVLTLLRFLV
jgi:hypothetical protein